MNDPSIKLLFESERMCVSEVPCESVPLNFLKLSNFPEISFQSQVTTSEESETKSLAVGLGDGKAESQVGAGPVSGQSRKDLSEQLAPFPEQLPAGSGTSAAWA